MKELDNSIVSKTLSGRTPFARSNLLDFIFFGISLQKVWKTENYFVSLHLVNTYY